jgi:hypothetical protein
MRKLCCQPRLIKPICSDKDRITLLEEQMELQQKTESINLKFLMKQIDQLL